jgi:hypothetical protein
MWENILLAILGGGNIVVFIKFLIERHDRKKERAEDKADAKAEAEDDEKNELAAIKDRLTKLEKDGIRTQLLLMILLRPEEKTEILRVAEYYFVKLRANWYMTGMFKTWCDAHGLEPEWFDADN